MEIDHKKIGGPSYWHEACEYLSQKDHIMAGLIAKYKGEVLSRKNNGFHTLIRAIVGQQISVKAADSIWMKLEKLMQNNIHPKRAIELTVADLRGIGFSHQKVTYFINCANFFLNELEGKLDLAGYDYDELSGKMIEIKGVGQWTVDMFMMFHMHAPDVMPIGDLGVVNAVKELYIDSGEWKKMKKARGKKAAKRPAPSAKAKNKKITDEKAVKLAEKKQLIADIMEISENWRPYRTVAVWHLWRHLDPVPVAY